MDAAASDALASQGGPLARERRLGAGTNGAATVFTNVLPDVHMPQNLLMETGRVRQSRVVLAPVAGAKSAEVWQAQPGEPNA